MSQTSLEAMGKTIEEAIQKGLARLGLPRDAVEIRVIREGSRGLLGLGSEDAIVRLTPREAAGTTPPVAEAGLTAHVPAPETLAPGALASVAAEPEAKAEGEPLTPERVAEIAKESLTKLLHGMGIRSRVEVQRDLASEESRAFVLNIVGEDLGILIGRRGETLRDLEYLTRLLVAQQTGKQARLVVDVEGYRTRRERVLNELAKRMAERVQSNRQPITLEAMPPNERRIIHLALRDHPSVTTQSIGEGDHRRVMILPK
jgi:spoIIIJ-associated protein